MSARLDDLLERLLRYSSDHRSFFSRQHTTGTLLALEARHELVAMRSKLAVVRPLERPTRPFLDLADELSRRRWNPDQVVVALDNPDEPHRLLASDFFALRQSQ